MIIDKEKYFPDNWTICIAKNEYERLLKRDEFLTALEAGGVDNWEWYHESTKHLYVEEE